MNTLFQIIGYSIFIGAGATLFMDIYAVLVKRFFNISSLDYAIVGRWIGNFKNGIFAHQNIIQSEKVKGERIIGWISHYVIGVSFAFLLLWIYGINWLKNPTFFPCIILGIATTIAPWFFMQPAFGFGFAASKTPNPAVSRLRSLQAHFIYGLGLYLAVLLLSCFLNKSYD